jgi:hypothetical protein
MMTIVRRTSPFGELMSLPPVTTGTAIPGATGREPAPETATAEQSPVGAKA